MYVIQYRSDFRYPKKRLFFPALFALAVRQEASLGGYKYGPLELYSIWTHSKFPWMAPKKIQKRKAATSNRCLSRGRCRAPITGQYINASI